MVPGSRNHWSGSPMLFPGSLHQVTMGTSLLLRLKYQTKLMKSSLRLIRVLKVTFFLKTPLPGPSGRRSCPTQHPEKHKKLKLFCTHVFFNASLGMVLIKGVHRSKNPIRTRRIRSMSANQKILDQFYKFLMILKSLWHLLIPIKYTSYLICLNLVMINTFSMNKLYKPANTA